MTLPLKQLLAVSKKEKAEKLVLVLDAPFLYIVGSQVQHVVNEKH